MPEATLILKSGGCSWHACTFCGYGRLRGQTPTEENLAREFLAFFSRLSAGTDTIKVFGSGSFLDEKQVPKRSRELFARQCLEHGIRRLTIESRPEYITQSALSDFKGVELTVAVGLEVADDAMLNAIRKGFHLADFEKAADTLKAAGAKVRAYLLVNIPGESDGVLDKSVEYAISRSDSVVLINLLPHGNTPLFGKWLDGEWSYLSREEFAKKTGKWAGNPKVELDAETFKFTPKFPQELKKPLTGVGEEYLTNPAFEVWQDYLARWYHPPKDRMLLILPCSRTKPYSMSETHQKITRVLENTGTRRLFHEVMVSNAGLVPREFEDSYPFNSYDWDERLETPEIKQRYIEITELRIEAYLRAHREYINGVYCYLKHDAESFLALERACRKLGKGCKNFLTKEAYEKTKGLSKPLQQPESLASLEESLKCLRQNST
ncbi:MAG: DUF5591 domain-containing protein [Candidatus Altiarchaeota archaeon]|nr:DUF5591 domain-containing protein [Candidatus Altiarchaeota archaeon]